jgi:hypothetical protein
MPYLRQIGKTDALEQTTSTIPVSVAGVLSSEATITLAAGVDFKLEKTTLTPADVAEGATATFNVKIIANNSGVYDDNILILNSGLPDDGVLAIPVHVNYTKPAIEVVGTVAPVATTLVPATIPVEVKGLLNTAAHLSLTGANASAFTLSQDAIAPEALAGNASATFSVAFTAKTSGQYVATIVIENEDIITVTIPLTVNYTKPSLKLVNEVVPVTAGKVPVIIPISVIGALNNAASIRIANVSGSGVFTLSKETITPAEVAEDLAFPFEVSFTVNTKGTYIADVMIGNDDIETLTIPLKIIYQPVTGIDPVSKDGISVWASKGFLHITGAPAGSEVNVLSLHGQSLLQTTIRSINEQYSLSLPTGVYVVKIGDKVWKIVK